MQLSLAQAEQLIRSAAGCGVLAEEAAEGQPFSLTLCIAEGCVSVTIDGLENRELEANLAAQGPFEPTLHCPLDVKMFLDALVEKYEITRASDGAFSVCMQKRIV